MYLYIVFALRSRVQQFVLLNTVCSIYVKPSSSKATASSSFSASVLCRCGTCCRRRTEETALRSTEKTRATGPVSMAGSPMVCWRTGSSSCSTWFRAPPVRLAAAVPSSATRASGTPRRSRTSSNSIAVATKLTIFLMARVAQVCMNYPQYYWTALYVVV